MITRNAIWLGLTILASGLQAVAAQVQPALTVAHQARRLQPGEVVLLVVTSPAALSELRADAFGGRVDFHQDAASGRWLGLAGLDIELKPGRHEVRFDARASDGTALHARHDLVVRARTFPVRQLAVDEAFVNPPASERPRIEQEGRAVEEVLARVSPERWWAGSFVRPVPGEATSGFGRRNVLNGVVRSVHAAVDLRAHAGTPVHAPNRGRVALSAEHYFAGKLVILDHGLGLFSVLAHLSSLAVAEGQMVERGEVVGLSGATGRVTGPHLHWGVRLGGARVDPVSLMTVLQKGPPRVEPSVPSQ